MEPKVVVLDIETTSLQGDSGILVGAGLMPENGPAEYLGVAKTVEEKKVLSKLLSKLEDYDLVVTWNGRSFDIPFLVTRLLSQGLDPRHIVGLRHIDLGEV